MLGGCLIRPTTPEFLSLPALANVEDASVG